MTTNIFVVKESVYHVTRKEVYEKIFVVII